MGEVKVKHWQSFRHNLMWNTFIGKKIRNVVGRVGIRLLKLARKCLRWSCYRCSWCGLNPGMGHMSKKGMRCSTIDRRCSEMPFE